MTRGKSKVNWHRVRALTWQRDEGSCVVCGIGLDPDQWECHHRRYRSRGGRNDLSNLIAVCPKDHVRIHQGNAATALENGWAVSQFGLPPHEIPVRYYDGRLVHLSNDLGVAA